MRLGKFQTCEIPQVMAVKIWGADFLNHQPWYFDAGFPLPTSLDGRKLLEGATIVFFTAGYAGKRFIYERAMQLGVKSVAQLQTTALNKRSNGKNRFRFVFWIDIFCIFL